MRVNTLRDTSSTIIIVLMLLAPGVTYAQFGSEEIGIPSPTATSLAVYGETPVSLYTGSINPSIPIHVASSGNLSLPITLTYNGSGVKASEIPGWAGLSWALEAGGVITRVVRGKPDDQGTIGYLSTKNLLDEFIDNYPVDPDNGCTSYTTQNCTEYISSKLMVGHADSEQDHFYINFPGGSGSFIIDLNGDVKVSDFSPLDITYDTPSSQVFVNGGGTGVNETFTGIPSWTVLDASGNKYTFSDIEYSYDRTTWSTQLNGNSAYISAWYLSKIESADGLHLIDISYSSPVILDRYLDTFSNKYIALNAACTNIGATVSTQQMITRYGLIWPTEITTSSEKITFVTSTKASGLLAASEKRLDGVKVWNKSNELKKEFSLSYNTSWSNRTRLVSVVESDAYGNELPAHDLEYYTSYSLPDPDSPNIDHWGYANGQNNSTLIPSQSLPGFFAYSGANRNSNATYADIGMLKKITYPTGGYSLFEYENHDYGSVGEDLVSSSYTKSNDELLETTNAQQGTFEISFSVVSHDSSNVGINISSSISNSIAHLQGTGPYTQILDDTNTSVYLHQHDAASTNNDTDYISLAPGVYTLKLSDPYSNSSASIDIDWTNSFPATIDSPGLAEDAGGPRIKKITQYDGVSTANNVVKSYTYNLQGEPTRSSGVLAKRPRYFYNTSPGNIIDGGNGTLCDYIGLNSQAIFPIGSGGSMIEYDEVKEEITSASGTGYSYHKFNTTKNASYQDDEIDVLTWPYQIIGDRSKLRGGLNTNLVYNGSNNLLQKTEIDYSTLQTSTVKALAFKVDAPTDLNNNEAVFFHIYYNNLFWHPKTVETVSVYNGAVTPTVSKTEYTYNLTNHQPKTVTTTNSLTSEKQKTTYKYAYEQYSAMATANMLVQPYSVLVEDGVGADLSKTWTEWTNSSSVSPGSLWRAWKQWSWKGTGTAPATPSTSNAVKVGEVQLYDTYGNPLKIEDAAGGVTKAYYGSNSSPFSQSGLNGVSGVYLTGVQKVLGTDNCASNCGTRPGSGDDLFTEAEYDDLGRVERVIDENEQVVGYDYDSFNRLITTTNANGFVVRANGYGYSAIRNAGTYSATDPNNVEQVTYIDPLYATDFSSSTGWSSVTSHNAFNIQKAGETTVRMGSGGSYETMLKTIGSTDLIARIDFYPDNTTGGTPHIYLDSGGNRFAVQYLPGSDDFRIQYRINSGSFTYPFTFPLDGSPNRWYTIELQKAGGELTAWVYPKGESRDPGNTHTVTGFSSSWAPEFRLTGNSNYYYAANLSVATFSQSSISYVDGLGREIQTQARGGSIVIATETLYDERGLPEVAARPLETTATAFPGYYTQGLLSGGTTFTPSSTGTAIPSSAPVHSYYAPIVATANDEDFAYSQTQYEASPLARVEKSTLPGTSHQMGSGKEVTTTYSLNTTETFATSAQGSTPAKTWAVNTLNKTVTEDPDGKKTITYTNGWGQTIASGVDMSGDSKLTRGSTDLVTEFAYDTRGNLVRVEDPRGLATTYTYNTLGQLTSKSLPDKSAADDYRYDSRGNVRFVETAKHKNNGSQTTLHNTNLYSDKTVTMPGDGIVDVDITFTVSSSDDEVDFDFEYTDGSDLFGYYFTAWETSASFIHPVGKGDYKLNQDLVFAQGQYGFEVDVVYKPNKFSYTNYDEFNRVTETGEYYGTSTFSGINAENDVTSNNIALQKYYYGEAHAKAGANNTKGRLAKAEYRNPHGYNSWGITWYSYNSLGLVEWVIQDLPGSTMGEIKITYTYDELGRQTQMGYNVTNASDDHYFWYEYDELGRLEYVYSDTDSNPTGRIKEAEYSSYAADGSVAQMKLGNSNIQTVDYSYTVQGWLDKINSNNVSAATNGDRFSIDLDYNLNGNISIQKWKQSQEHTLYYSQYAYTYDTANRLTAANYTNSNTSSLEDNGGGFDATYSYDKNGNMLTAVRKGEGYYAYPEQSLTATTITGTSNRISTYSVQNGPTSPTPYTVVYDANGNMTQNRFTGAVYNERNLMNKVTKGGSTVYFGYDSEGNRVQKKLSGGVETHYVRGAGGETIAIYENGTRAFVNLLGPGGEILGTYDGSQRRYFLKDHLRSVRTTVDQSGNVDGYDDYYPFGLTMPGRSSNASNPTDNYKFTGHELDAEAGLDIFHMNARGMDPVTGRFMQIDPLSIMYPSLSPYHYVHNNPLNMIDPTGMSSNSIAVKTGTAGEIIVEEGDTYQDVLNFFGGDAATAERVWAQACFSGGIYDSCYNVDTGRYTEGKAGKDISVIDGQAYLDATGFTPLDVLLLNPTKFVLFQIFKGTKGASNSVIKTAISSALKTIKQGGDNLVEFVVKTPAGKEVTVIAEVSSNSGELALKNLTVYNSNGGNLENEILSAVLSNKTELIKAAKDLGFDKLRITAERALNSTSAKPGKLIDTTLDLKNY